jgi:hypothetical protein
MPVKQLIVGLRNLDLNPEFLKKVLIILKDTAILSMKSVNS